jgi:hypothetical protein
VRAGGAVALVLAACAGKPAATRGDGAGSASPAGAAVLDARAAAVPDDVPGARLGYRRAATAGTIEVRVEWADAPSTMRGSPGVSPCGAPLPPRVRVHTLGGVAGALVIADVPAGRGFEPAAVAAELAVEVDGCVPSPEVVVRGPLPTDLTVRSLDGRPHAVSITTVATLTSGQALLDAREPDGPLPAVRLAWAGAAVRREVRESTLLRVATEGAPTHPAFVAVVGTPYAGVTDETGAVTLGAAPAGTYPVTAWLPPRAGAPARVARGSVTVGAPTDAPPAPLVLSLAPAP